MLTTAGFTFFANTEKLMGAEPLGVAMVCATAVEVVNCGPDCDMNVAPIRPNPITPAAVMIAGLRRCRRQLTGASVRTDFLECAIEIILSSRRELSSTCTA